MLAGSGDLSLDGIDLSALTGAAGGGVLTAILLMILMRKGLVPEWTLKKAEDESESKDEQIRDLREQIDKLNSVLQTQVIPALVQSNQIVGNYNDEVRIRRLAGGRDGT